MIPIGNDSIAKCATVEDRVLEHCIQRAVAGESPPAAYRISDRDFIAVVRRTHATIVRENGTTHVDLGFGSTIARVVAGGLSMADYEIELVERGESAPSEFTCRAPGMQPCECCEARASRDC